MRAISVSFSENKSDSSLPDRYRLISKLASQANEAGIFLIPVIDTIYISLVENRFYFK
jgi:hypothetical protein